MIATRPIPAALARTGSTIRAAGPQSIEAMYAELSDTLRNGFVQNRERAENLEAAMQAMQEQINNGAVSGTSTILPVEPAYTQAFASYFRRGDGVDVLKAANATGERATVHAAMSVGSNTDGGYLAPVEWDRKLQERQRATSPMRRLATTQTTTTGAFTTLWNLDNWGSGWVGETAARPLTTSAGLAPITFAAGEIYAMPAATQRLLDDSAINVESWLAQSVEREFNRQEGIAFISGDGVNKPAGLLTYVTGGANAATHPGGALEVATGIVDIDPLTDTLYGLGSAYRQNASWVMSSLTAARIAKLKDNNGQLIWRESVIVGQPATLLGRPVEIDEAMPAPTSGNLAIAFGDFKAGYLINDRIGTRILRDPYTNKPFVNFYVTKRVGGGVLDPFAIRLLRVA
ncbi:phage major capsid protein [Sphingomonas sp.]|uniref:phage major capsid protein n=1 Tax=Sphingomonas sp. TaxID=28214 RepID=UPI0035BC4FED